MKIIFYTGFLLLLNYSFCQAQTDKEISNSKGVQTGEHSEQTNTFNEYVDTKNNIITNDITIINCELKQDIHKGIFIPTAFVKNTWNMIKLMENGGVDVAFDKDKLSELSNHILKTQANKDSTIQISEEIIQLISEDAYEFLSHNPGHPKATNLWAQIVAFGGLSCLPLVQDTSNMNNVYYVAETGGRASNVIKAFPISEGIRRVQLDNGKFGYTKNDSTLLTSTRWTIAYDFSDGLGLVCNEGECYYLNTEGEEVLRAPVGFEKAYPFYNDRALIQFPGDQYYFIDRKRKVRCKRIYAMADRFSNGMAPVAIKNKPRGYPYLLYGFINKNGKFKIKPSYANALPFSSDGVTAVKDAELNKWYFIDINETRKSSQVYDNVELLSNGLFLAKTDYYGVRNGAYTTTSYSYTLFNPKGVSIPSGFQSVDTTAYDLIVYTKNHKAGVIDVNGATVVAAQYYDIKIVTPEIFKLKADNKWLTAYATPNMAKPEILFEEEIEEYRFIFEKDPDTK